MKQIKLLFLSLALFFCFLAFASPGLYTLETSISLPNNQQQLISGKVIDKTTKAPIPFCNVAVLSSSIGTATNELGEFVLTVDKLPAILVFSHLNYSQYRLEISKTTDLVIVMNPLTTVLEEVVVLAEQTDSQAVELVQKAFRKAEKNSDTNYYGRAFYRQKSKNGESYSEFSEIFYDIRYNANGIKDWNINEGRYALKDNEIFNRNFTVFSRILKPLQPNTKELIFPLHPNLEQFYQLKLVDIIQADMSKIAVINCKPLPNNNIPTFKGEVYIDMNSHDILKIKGQLYRDDLNLVKLSTSEGTWKDYSIAYDITYKRDSLSNAKLDYIKVDQAFDYYRNDSLQYRSTTTSNLTFYEHYESTSKKRLGGRLRTGKSDWKKLDEVGYNELFWANNPIVKRTPIEEEVIQSFEQKNAFSSIFLNSAENIAVMNSNVSQDPFIKAMTAKTRAFIDKSPVEKVFLHCDKSLFAPAENLWYSAYVVLGPEHQYSRASGVLHVDLVSPNNSIVKSQTHELIEGRGSGNLKLPENLVSGRYQLRAYTQYMRNFDTAYFFSKTIDIVNPMQKALEKASKNHDKIDLQFFPEGGHLVAGLPTKVAFKAIGEDGNNKVVKGSVLDASGKQQALFSTLDRGGGFFQFLPLKNEQYVAVLENGEEFKLPKVLDEGYSLTATNLNEKAIKIKVRASALMKNKSFYIVGHLNQKKYYQSKFDFGKEELLGFEIPKTKMPSGVLTITLLDENKKAWCERAVFINNQEELIIHTKIESEQISKRDQISIDVHITDTDGQAVTTEFSIAVTDSGQVIKDKGGSNMLSELLLQSEVKGAIYKPGLLFNDQKRATLNALDLVMLTHAWRKFHWPSIWNSTNSEKKFDFSNGLVVSGTAQNLNGSPFSNGVLRIVANANDYLSMFTVKTSENGTFVIPDANFSGRTQLIFNAVNSYDKLVDVKITLDEKVISTPPSSYAIFGRFVNNQHQAYAGFSTARIQMDSIYTANNITNLEEVTVVAAKKERPSETPSIYGILPDITIYPQDRGPLVDIFQLLRGLPGLRVFGSGFDTEISIRNGGSPLWIVDGFPVLEGSTIPINEATVGDSNGASGAQAPTGFTEDTGEGIENNAGLAGENAVSANRLPTAPVPDFIKTIDVNAIEKIEVHKGASSGGISGLRGQDGAIVIYTKQANKTIVSPSFEVMGHTADKEFYSPKYNVQNDKHHTPDYRATLYWNPKMKTDANGNASAVFFNSDVAKKIQISIEALSDYGLPGAYLKVYGENK